jgi:hypothetical protein
VLFLLSCSISSLQPPTTTPTPTLTPIPTLTSTPLPTNTPVPTNTKPPPCNADQTLKNLKQTVTYEEFVVLYQKLQDTSFLVIWFIDPEINPSAKENEISENAQLAIRHAFILSQQLKGSDDCVNRLFNFINPVVVDKNYNGWFSGQVSPSDLPATLPTDDQQLAEYSKLFQTGYLRSKTTAKISSAPAGSCAWQEAKKNIQNHFSPDRENVAFYFVLDDEGVNVWAQWDSEPEFLQLNLPASILNIAMEIDCLFPKPDRIIFDAVDQEGEIHVYGIWNQADMKNQDISKIQILYQK